MSLPKIGDFYMRRNPPNRRRPGAPEEDLLVIESVDRGVLFARRVDGISSTGKLNLGRLSTYRGGLSENFRKVPDPRTARTEGAQSDSRRDRGAARKKATMDSIRAEFMTLSGQPPKRTRRLLERSVRGSSQDISAVTTSMLKSGDIVKTIDGYVVSPVHAPNISGKSTDMGRRGLSEFEKLVLGHLSEIRDAAVTMAKAWGST